jgi:hypothetical protein
MGFVERCVAISIIHATLNISLFTKVVGLRASNNNRASTVLIVFTTAIEEHGWPSRVRGDRGGENKKVAVVMIRKRGLNRASFMWGK